MEAIPIIICGIIGLAFVAAVILMVLGWICDRKGTRKVKDKASRYFEQ